MRQIASLVLLSLLAGTSPAAEKAFRPGKRWPDNNGVHINCHGGGVLVHGKTFYWFGQHMIEGKAGNFGRTKGSPCEFPLIPRATLPRAASSNAPK